MEGGQMEVVETYEEALAGAEALKLTLDSSAAARSARAFAVELQDQRCYSTVNLGKAHKITEDA
jgi:hypothetical protein